MPISLWVSNVSILCEIQNEIAQAKLLGLFTKN